MYCMYCGKLIPEGGHCNCEKARKARTLEAVMASKEEQDRQAAQEGENTGEGLQSEIQPEVQSEKTPEAGSEMHYGPAPETQTDMPNEPQYETHSETQPPEPVQETAEPASDQVTSSQPQQTEQPVSAKPVNEQTPTAPNEKKPIDPNIIRFGVIGAIVLVIVIAIIVFFSTRRTTIDLNDYVTVGFEGYDTVGTLDWDFDLEAFEEKYEDTLRKNLKKALEKEYGDELDEELSDLREFTGDSKLDFDDLLDLYGETASEIFYYGDVGIRFSKYSELSNGEVIELTWHNDDDEILELFNVNVKYEDAEYTVSGLEEAGVFDPFEGMEVVFDGISPFGTAEIVFSDGAEGYDLNYKLSKDRELSNGETVTVTVSAGSNKELEEYCLSNYGMIPSASEKEFTVDGLEHYVTSISEISSSALADMQSQAEDVYYAHVAQNPVDGETFQSLDYIGSYLLTSKTDETSGGTRNYYYLIYRANYFDEYSNNDQVYRNAVDVYWYIRYNNLVVDDSGETVVDVMDYQSSFNTNDKFTVDSGIRSGWSTKKWTYNGYETLDDLYKVVVTSQLEKFNHEDAVEDIPTVNRAAVISADTEETEAETGEETVPETTATEETSSEETVPQETAAEEVTEATEGSEEDEAELKQAEVTEASASDGFIFPDSDTRLITSPEASALSDQDLRYAINEIYARHGYIFEDKELLNYFRQFDWYKETTAKSRFSESVFNSVERANLDLLSAERNRR